MFSPTVLRLLRLLSAHPGGVSREELLRGLGVFPDRVDRALDRLLELGLVEQQGNGLVVPLPKLKPLAHKMERLAARLNRRAQERDRAMDLIRMVIRGR